MKLLWIVAALLIPKLVFADSYVCNADSSINVSNIPLDHQRCLKIETIQIQPDNPVDQSVNFFQYKDPNLGIRLRDLLIKNPVAFKVAYFGDSHVQNGISVSSIRHVFSKYADASGKGMLFPFSIAKTYSHNDFKSTYFGDWKSSNSMHQYPKLPLGISGFTAKTSDEFFGFALQFSKKSVNLQQPRNIYLYYTADDSDYTVNISCVGNSAQGILNRGNNTKVIKNFVCENDEITFKFGRTEGSHGELSIHGVQIDNVTSGISVHNLGVGGATYGAINSQKLFSNHVAILNPDVVVLDYGTNDIIYNNVLSPHLEETIVKTINTVRKFSNNPLIIMPSVQAMRFKGRSITVASEFNQLVKRLALENGCIYYDWFDISGGRPANQKWQSLGLASSDGVHLTTKGYQLKGELFGTAFVNTAKIAQFFPGNSVEIDLYPNHLHSEPKNITTHPNDKKSLGYSFSQESKVPSLKAKGPTSKGPTSKGPTSKGPTSKVSRSSSSK